MATVLPERATRQRVPLFIGGRFVDAMAGTTFEDRNPSTETVIADVAEASAEDVDRAAQAARHAFESGPWPRMSRAERRQIMHRIADLMETHKEELARLETTDNGKPIRETLNIDIPRAIGNLRTYGDLLAGLETEAYPADGVTLNYTLREPAGVAGLITPWNFPLMIFCSKFAPAIAMGNTVVAKPAEWTPLTASRFAELTADAGLPEGVFNLVHGFGPEAAGEAIARHPEINMISFTGETTTGQAIMAAGAKTLKRLSFEMGGKGATIVFADVDFDQALDVAATAAFRNQGQICVAGSRILVEEKLYDRFLSALVERANRIKVGDPLSPETEMGPLVHSEHRQRVQHYLDTATSDVEILCGGKTPAGATSPNFLEPTVIRAPNYRSRICQEEVFGPVVTVTPFKTDDEAVAITNSTKYGLSSTVCTSNLNRAHRAAAQLKTGTVWINCWSIRDPRVPFGGYKYSGVGREGGRHSMEFFSEIKNVCLKL